MCKMRYTSPEVSKHNYLLPDEHLAKSVSKEDDPWGDVPIEPDDGGWSDPV